MVQTLDLNGFIRENCLNHQMMKANRNYLTKATTAAIRMVGQNNLLPKREDVVIGCGAVAFGISVVVVASASYRTNRTVMMIIFIKHLASKLEIRQQKD